MTELIVIFNLRLHRL